MRFPALNRTKLRNGLVVALLLGTAGKASAAPGTLANIPLFLGMSAEPNVLFLLDDSGSMGDHNTFMGAIGGVLVTDRAREIYDPDEIVDNDRLDFTPNTLTEVREHCRPYNAMAYDPTESYTPWAGEDINGDPYGDVDVQDAPRNPYFGSSTVDLTGDFYVRWGDANGNGQYDEGECLTPGVGGSATPVFVSNMSAAQQQNFANWYSYYRLREYVMKRAVTELIDTFDMRMGLATLHNHDRVATPITDVESGSHRQDLLNAASRIDSGGGTPLRQKLEDAGQYYDQTPNSGDHDLGFADDNPWLAGDGGGGTCQQSFTLLMTDGTYNGDPPGKKPADFGANEDGGKDGDGDTDYDGGSYADEWDNTLADVAMYYYESDLHTGLDNKVPTSEAIDDRNSAQKMVTYTIGFGVSGTLRSNPPNFVDPFEWPEPESQSTGTSATAIDDVRHAAWNGRGQYLSANDPQELIDAMDRALSDIAGRASGTGAALEFSSGSVQLGEAAFLTLFDSADWTGDVQKIQVDPQTGELDDQDEWRAANVLDGQDPDDRVILTSDGTSGLPFRWGKLTNGQQQALNTDRDGNQDGNGNLRLAYLRGDQTQESPGSTPDFRDRETVLGDIVNSGARFIGDPQRPWPDADPFPTGNDAYSRFRSGAIGNATERKEVVYVGANDGMLHGFASETGEEVLAYVPDALFSQQAQEGLHYLTQPEYQHRFYVNQTPTVSDIYANLPLGNGDEWRTVLVGGLGAGGRGIYALDVTEPGEGSNDSGTFTEGNAADLALWEFTDEDDADLGFTFSEPVIARTAEGWAAIFGNGYNSTNGVAKLFIASIEKGVDGWQSGDYVKISTEAGSSGDKNGLSSPTVVDTDGDSVADRVYAGDLFGNMWAFDISGSNDNQWEVAYTGQGQTPQPLFTADPDSARVQPITVRPRVIRHPSVGDGSAPNLMLYFGTGQYIASGDVGDDSLQSFYGVWDQGEGGITREDLQEQTFLNSNNSSARVTSNDTVGYITGQPGFQQLGWYFDLVDSNGSRLGERVVSVAEVRGDNVFFNTIIPEQDKCSFGGGGWLFSVSQINGSSPEAPAFDFNNSGGVDAEDKVTVIVDGEEKSRSVSAEKFDMKGMPAASAFNKGRQYTGGTESSGADGENGQTVDIRELEGGGGANTGRQSWQELTFQ